MSYGTLVTDEHINIFMGLAEDAVDEVLAIVVPAVEEWVKKSKCKQDFVSTTYKERLDGTGTQDLYLDNYPIISLSQLSVDSIECMTVKNTNAGLHASVSVTSTGVVLNKDGTINTILFADQTTLSAIAAAINAIAGWSASVITSSYNTFPSTSLLEAFGKQCINNRDVSLYIPDTGEYDFEVYPEEGRVFLYSGFPEGRRNIYVEYVAGYATIPADLELAVCILVKTICQRRSEETFGVTSFSLSGISASFEQHGIPIHAQEILDKYTRFIVA